MQSSFENLQHLNAGFGKLKMLMSALQDENAVQNILDLEEQKRCIYETIVTNEKWRESWITNEEDSN